MLLVAALSAGGHAPSVAGGELARQCTLCRVRPDLRQCPEAAGLAVSLVQGHRKDVPTPVPTPLAAQTALPLLCASLRKLVLEALVLHPPALLVQVFLCSQVHSACKELLGKRCPLGQYKVSIIPPTALNSIDSDGESWRAQGCSGGGDRLFGIGL